MSHDSSVSKLMSRVQQKTLFVHNDWKYLLIYSLILSPAIFITNVKR